MEQKRIKVRLTEKSPYSEYGYYKKGDIGYIDGYVNDNAVIILENGKFAKADLRWIEVVNEEDKNVNTELAEGEDERIKKALIKLVKKAGEGYENVIDGVSIENAIAWLGKQGEHKKFRDSIQVGDKVTRNQDGVLVNLSQLNRVAKKQGEQKHQYNSRPRYVGEEELLGTNKQEKCPFLKQELIDMGFAFTQDGDLAYPIHKIENKESAAWKPSKEQMEALQNAIGFVGELTTRGCCLKKLKAQLEKLREE